MSAGWCGMPEPRFPTMEEFWRRLERRRLEPDLQQQLRQRGHRERQGVQRLPAHVTVAVMARLVPATAPPHALAAFVDEYFDQQVGLANETVGVLPRQQLIPLGFATLDDTARQRHGQPFADLADEEQDQLLSQAEQGELPGEEGFDSSTWFELVRFLALLGLGSDPRGMVFMGYPGPSYQPGHLWLDEGEVAARAARRRGYWTL